MFITEDDILKLEQDLISIEYLTEEITDITTISSPFIQFVKMTPDRLASNFSKLTKVTDKFGRLAKVASNTVKKKYYIRKCNDYLQSKTYFNDSDINKLISNTGDVLHRFIPNNVNIDKNKLEPFSWAMTTVSVAMFIKKNPNKRLTLQETTSEVKRVCKNVYNKISLESKSKVPLLFFIFLTLFFLNLIFFQIFNNTDILPRSLSISLILIYIYFLKIFILQQVKSGGEQQNTLNESVDFSDNVIKSVKTFNKNYIKPDVFIKNIDKINNIFLKSASKPSNIKVTALKFIDSAEDYIRQNSNLTGTEISTTSAKIIKYVISIFDISQRATLLLPVSWLAMIYITIQWQKDNPGKKITKDVIIKLTKEYFYKSSLKWSKYKLQTPSQKRLKILIIPYLYFTLLYYFPIGNIVDQKLGANYVSKMYILAATVYMINALLVVRDTIQIEEK